MCIYPYIYVYIYIPYTFFYFFGVYVFWHERARHKSSGRETTAKLHEIAFRTLLDWSRTSGPKQNPLYIPYICLKLDAPSGVYLDLLKNN